MNIKKIFQITFSISLLGICNNVFSVAEIYDQSEFLDLNNTQEVEVITDIGASIKQDSSEKKVNLENDLQDDIQDNIQDNTPVISESDIGIKRTETNTKPSLGNFSIKNLSMPQRITRLENIAESNNFYQQEKTIQELRAEIQVLTGKVEEQDHKIKQYQNQIDAQNKDINRRMDNIIAALKNNKGHDIALDKDVSTGDVEKDFYTKGYEYLKAKQYSKAVFQLQSYINKYPDGKYIANATYWLGEVYLLQSNLSGAMDAFNTIINKYPNSDKVREAMLKKGVVYIYQQNLTDAKKTFENIKKKYPNTVVARLADSRLQQIKEQFE